MRRKKQLVACVLSFALLLGTLPPGTTPISRATSERNTELGNPTMDSGGVATWDCVYFGNYWQNDTNGDGKADKSDDKEPIKWRVLSVDGDDAFLIADQNLDYRLYNDDNNYVTWETCTMRSWLNGYGADSNVCETDYTDDNFIDNAFSADEQLAIKDTTVVTADNVRFNTKGGNDTTDKVYLLSMDELRNLSYWLTQAGPSNREREAKNTFYATTQGVETSPRGNGPWWLRSSGQSQNKASFVYDFGMIDDNGHFVSHKSIHFIAVRPALHLNLSSDSGWSYAGTVTSQEKPSATPTVTPSEAPTVQPSESPTVQPSESPTVQPSEAPTIAPSATPTVTPSATPAVQPSEAPTITPSEAPTVTPSEAPTVTPSATPTVMPSATPTVMPSATPTVMPSATPAVQPSEAPETGQKPAQVTGLKLKAKKNVIQASWKKAAGAKGYQLWYSTSKKWGKKKTKNTKKTKLTLGKLKSKKTYYIRVRAYTIQNGKKEYGRWSKIVKKKVK